MAVSATLLLSDFVSGVQQLPALVAERAKLHIADTLACIYAGTSSPAVALLARVSAPPEDGGRVIVPGMGCWNDPSLAAMLIGVCAHADDFDDTSEHSMNGHPSAPIVSALVATACVNGASGEDFVRAYAVGVQVACKLGIAFGPAHTRRGWHTLSTLGALGATAACANLRGLNARQTQTAMAIACSLAGGILGNTGTMTKSLHCGRAAQAGYLAAALAEQGFTAGADILEGQAGFLDTLTDRSLSRVNLSGIGENWELVETGLAVKLYPCCSCTHLAIDGAIVLRRRHSLDPMNIAKVICRVREECTHYLRFPNPSTGIEAKFSMNYTVAVALARGEVNLGDFDTPALAREDIAGLALKIRMDVRPEATVTPDIEILLQNGTRLTECRDAPRGGPEDPPSWEDIAEKLNGAVARAAKRGPADLQKFVSSIRQMDKQSRFVDILRL